MKQRYFRALAALVGMVGALSAEAQVVITWSGSGGDNLWGTPSNWTPNGPPSGPSGPFPATGKGALD